MADVSVRIEQIAQRPLVMIDGQATLRQAAQLLSEESIGVAILRGGHPPVLISERDIVRAIAEGIDPDDDTVESVATYDVATASPLDTVEDVARIMLDNEVRHVPLVADGAIVGVASTRDVLTVLLAPTGGLP